MPEGRGERKEVASQCALKRYVNRLYWRRVSNAYSCTKTMSSRLNSILAPVSCARAHTHTLSLSLSLPAPSLPFVVLTFSALLLIAAGRMPLQRT